MTTPDTADGSLTQRHWIALTALISLVVAVYLHLFKLGKVGPLSCSTGGGCGS